jgi:hypothetical protein
VYNLFWVQGNTRESDSQTSTSQNYTTYNSPPTIINMSPIVARAAVRAAGRRQFSLLTSARSFARSFEPHPFERIPVTQTAQRGDYAKMGRRVAGQAVFFAPAIVVLLGWPYVGYKMLNGHVI